MILDSYTPDKFSLDMFSADELLNGGPKTLVYYYGYDIYGNKLTTTPTLEDFFNNEKMEMVIIHLN